jgi:hypothetical protein
MPQFLSSIDCIGIDLAYKYPHRKKSRGFKPGEHEGQESGA